MKRTIKFSSIMSLLLIALGIFFFSACEKETTKADDQSYSVNQDVAESVSGTVGSNTGGAVDQIGDAIEIASMGGLHKSTDAAELNEVEGIEKTYDETTGVWTLHLQRERGNKTGKNYAQIERTYTYQFLNKLGQFQKFYITGQDTAYTINFNIVSGSGRHKTLRLSQKLLELTGSWTITNANLTNVTINGTYHRSATDTITTLKRIRTHLHSTDMTFIDVVAPRGSRWNMEDKISGTITGHYHAEVTWDGLRGYGEKTIDRDFTITFNNGEAIITVNGNVFTCDLGSGEMKGGGMMGGGM